MFARNAGVAAVVWCAGLGVVVPITSQAQQAYYDSQCSSCHGAAPSASRTCNGCHAHGTHATTGSSSARNISATTDKASYTDGDTMIVTLNGGDKPDAGGWVGVRIYDSTGAEVSERQRNTRCTRSPSGAVTQCDMPVQISVKAKAGWTELYVAWAGNEFDSAGASKGAAISGAIGVGSRPLKDANGNQINQHLEEVVKTASFTVAAASSNVGTSPTGTGAPSSAPSSSGGGGGVVDWVTLSSAMSAMFVGWRRKHSSK